MPSRSTAFLGKAPGLGASLAGQGSLLLGLISVYPPLSAVPVTGLLVVLVLGWGPEGRSQVHPGGSLEEVVFCIDSHQC